MIEFININDSEPYKYFLKYFNQAIDAEQKNIEAISISSFNFESKEVQSRYVNLKYIKNEEWIFFSNYNSPKSQDFNSHSQISALFYWNNIDVQIRMKAKINKTSSDFSNLHFDQRDRKKNALAISSNQSEKINSYDDVINKYLEVLNSSEKLERPNSWGGFSFVPYYFEFWEGHESRLNKRKSYLFVNKKWEKNYLQP